MSSNQIGGFFNRLGATSTRKPDLMNAEDKAFFEAALAWDLEIDGRKWVDGKNFK
ncbi:hypothetical protein BJ138DRAFT_1118452 [Hygrophoropsis aurantiaca]|uniref:Uncharacterized protein n=1 Tax=Hygrophoropsis aurantiaca TaxID=72124 RepID=A0ACB7ZX39_9AGAM|nr:hypothetical protein BJ138DRAFT_1118452 [Hygrophoropsis aurantiaca]